MNKSMKKPTPAARPAAGIPGPVAVRLDEAGLIRAAQAGSADAFDQLMAAYQRQIYALAYRLLGDAAAAADATQETMIAAYRFLRSFRNGSFKNWLLRIATRKSYDSLRDKHRRHNTSWDELAEHDWPPASHEDGPEAVAQRRELARRLEAGLATLPLPERRLVVLSDVHEMSYLEIAGVTGTQLGTVKSRLSRARRKLRLALQAGGALAV